MPNALQRFYGSCVNGLVRFNIQNWFIVLQQLIYICIYVNERKMRFFVPIHLIFVFVFLSGIFTDSNKMQCITL